MLQKDFYWLRAEYNKEKKAKDEAMRARMKEIMANAVNVSEESEEAEGSEENS